MEKQLEGLENKLTEYFKEAIQQGKFAETTDHRVVFRPVKNGECFGKVLLNTPDITVILWEISAGTLFEPHVHKERENYFFLSGKGVLYCNKSRVNLDTHDTYYCGANVLHAFYFPAKTTLLSVFCPAEPDIIENLERCDDY